MAISNPTQMSTITQMTSMMQSFFLDFFRYSFAPCNSSTPLSTFLSAAIIFCSIASANVCYESRYTVLPTKTCCSSTIVAKSWNISFTSRTEASNACIPASLSCIILSLNCCRFSTCSKLCLPDVKRAEMEKKTFFRFLSVA